MIRLELTDVEFALTRAAISEFTTRGVHHGRFDDHTKDYLRGLNLKLWNELRIQRGQSPLSLDDVRSKPVL